MSKTAHYNLLANTQWRLSSHCTDDDIHVFQKEIYSGVTAFIRLPYALKCQPDVCAFKTVIAWSLVETAVVVLRQGVWW